MHNPEQLGILMLTTEAAPYTNVGELGETVPPLAIALKKQGHDVRLILPRYYFIDRARLRLRREKVELVFNGQSQDFALYEDAFSDAAIPVYFIEYEPFFGRDGVYGLNDDGEFADNSSRFAYFNQAALAACQSIGWIPSILHAHDWPCGPSMVYLDTEQRYGPFAACSGLFTIHDIAFQGLFPADHFRFLDVAPSEFRPGSFEFFGRLNFTQGGIRHSPVITTISPSYAQDILTTRFGFGLEGILQERRADLHGILNGLDYRRWNPETDVRLAHNYSSTQLQGREADKQALQTALGLECSSRKIIISVISHLESTKGFIELMAPACLPRLLAESEVQMIIIGTGDSWSSKELKRQAELYPNLIYREWCPIDFLPQVLAASDFLLIPPIYEPSPFLALMAMRYGSIPVVSHAGALRDVVRNDPAHPEMSTGLLIDPPLRPEAIHQAAMQALALRRNEGAYRAMQQRVMGQRFTWEDAAQSYLMLYRTALERRRSVQATGQST